MNIEKEKPAYVDVIRSLMAEYQFSQEKFAVRIGVNQTTVSQWLLGNKKPGYDNILAICTCFGITPNEFFGL